ncbi:OmpA family protein [Blautia massiliensis (ex Durand et al. 2017)]|uniref:OmpA family protein n=1 Tax=Blautia massiliensis (ex Durand et al. 2017) TaxID=1737424 RepID=UPI00156D4520|nr:OmpA family protein [Blautia massiliensis (ex Durand et al. 2017)]NSG50040.1 OmpA family protein [Blautia massiliensis (ex Durand et al. 2017)]NSL01830.1 OmpA family protein [Blautia massiliensis (ex Durand et al. 2017)]
MARRKRKSNDEETSYWLSYSDMMAALLLIFVLIISFTMLQSKRQYEEKERELLSQQNVIGEQQDQLEQQKNAMESQKKIVDQQKEQMASQQAQLDKIIGVKSNLISALKDEFDGSDLSVSVDSQTGAITFDASVLFDKGKYEIKDEGKKFLDQFLPRYFSVLLKNDFHQYISEVIIEGHTDTTADYLYNLELSQQRALSVAKYCLDEKSSSVSKDQIEQLQKIMTANGRSFSNPVYNPDGTIDMDASRRVEFKFRLKDEEMVEEMAQILNKNDQAN